LWRLARPIGSTLRVSGRCGTITGVTTPTSPGTEPSPEPPTVLGVPAQPAPPRPEMAPAPTGANTAPPAQWGPPAYQPPGGYAPAPYPVPLPQGYQIPPGYRVPPGYPVYGYPPPPTSPAGYPLAEWIQRGVARLIDGLIVGGISSVILIPVYIYVVLSVIPPITTINGEPVAEINPFAIIGPMLGLIGFVFLLSFILNYVYEVELLVRGGGQTIGKRIMKIKVIPVDPAQTLTRGHAVRRMLAQFGLGLVPGLGLVNVLFPLWDKPYQQALHDKFAKTLVIKLGA